MATIEELYKAFGVLADAKENAEKHEAEYMLFIEAAKGNSSEKRLASQFMARFFNDFPRLASNTINALFDLCDDGDVNIRKQAIKDLTSVCRTCPQHIAQISEALSQLLVTEDSTELSVIQSSFVSLFAINAKSVLDGVFHLIFAEHADDDSLREKVLLFFAQKLSTVFVDSLNKETDDFILAQCKQVLTDVTKNEFLAVMDILGGLKSMSTVQGRQMLVDLITEQADVDQPLECEDVDCLDRLIHCARIAAPLFSKNVASKAFVSYICQQVIPVLDKLSFPEHGSGIQVELLKLFAEISEHAGELKDAEACVDQILCRLLEYMPLPPSEENDSITSCEEPKLKLSFVECLMFAFHQLARHCPNFLTSDSNVEKLRDFKIRLQYFARGVQAYMTQLRSALQGKCGDTLRTDENKIKVIALKITSNINALIKDLLHNPPSYKTNITLSWKPVTGTVSSSPGPQGEQQTVGGKRSTPTAFSNGTPSMRKVPKDSRQLYTPPGGKFSERAGSYSGRGGGRGWGYRGNDRG